MKALERRTIHIAVEACIVAIVILLIIGACRSGFVPSTPPTPLMTQRGEAHMAGYIGNHSFTGHLGYSPFDNIEAILAGSYNAEIDGGLRVSHRYGEALIGYYPTPSGGFRLDLLAGFGAGSFHDVIPGSPPSIPFSERGPGNVQQYSGEFTRLTLQGNFGWTEIMRDTSFGFGTLRNEMGGSLRISRVGFRSVASIDSITPERPAGLSVTRYRDQDLFSIDPTFFARFGTEHLMLEGQAGFSFPTSKTDVSWDFFHLAFGIQVIFGKDFPW